MQMYLKKNNANGDIWCFGVVCEFEAGLAAVGPHGLKFAFHASSKSSIQSCCVSNRWASSVVSTLCECLCMSVTSCILPSRVVEVRALR